MIYAEDHPFRMLRGCPHCSTIWLKVIGCENTYCGNRITDLDEIGIISSGTFYNNYEFFQEEDQKPLKFRLMNKN